MIGLAKSGKIAEILKPYKVIYQRSKDENRSGVITLEPFESGFGITIANSLRRVMFSSLDGFAITSVKITGVEHEFCAIPGIMEDAIDVISNLKSVKFKCDDQFSSVFVGKISVSGPCIVDASMISFTDAFSCVTPENYICEISEGSSLELVMVIKRDRGYKENKRVSDEDAKIIGSSVGLISLSSNHCPVESVSFEILKTSYGDFHNCDKVIMKVVTDGSITPDLAVKKASSMLVDQFSKISGDVHTVSLSEISSTDSLPVSSLDEDLCEKLMKDIDHLELTVRSHNCLKSAGATSVWALVQMNPGDLLRLANFGRKSLNEINEVLLGMGLSLGMYIPDSVFKLMSDKMNSSCKFAVKEVNNET